MSKTPTNDNYRAIFDAITDAIFIHDMKTGAILDVNQGTCDMYNYTQAEIVELNVEDISSGEPPYTLQEAGQMLQKAVDEGPQSFEWHSKRKGGELFWSEVSLRTITFDGEQQILAVVHDITQRKQDEEEREQMLRESRRLAAVLDNTSDLVSMADMQGKVLYVNNAGLEMTGRTRQDLSTLSIPDFHPPELTQRILDEHVPILMTEGIHSWENMVQHTNGHTIPVSQVSTLIRNEDGEPEAMATIMRDLTEHKQAEAEREKLQREVIEAQQQALKELATPIIPIMDRIIVLPLIGSIDSMRARDITRTLLSGIGQYRAKIVIIDITGVSLIDSGVANHLNKTIQAARLKGARTIVTGMSDAVAETIVDLGIDWSEMTTLSDLQTGLIVALDSLGIKLSNV